MNRTDLTISTLACLALSRIASAQPDPAYAATLAHTGEWVTCPDTGQRVARVEHDIPERAPLLVAQFSDWQRPFHAPRAGDGVVRCADGEAPFDPNGQGVHVEDSWRR